MSTTLRDELKATVRDEFLSALAIYIDDRIRYATADREWCNEPSREELDIALDTMLDLLPCA